MGKIFFFFILKTINNLPNNSNFPNTNTQTMSVSVCARDIYKYVEHAFSCMWIILSRLRKWCVCVYVWMPINLSIHWKLSSLIPSHSIIVGILPLKICCCFRNQDIVQRDGEGENERRGNGTKCMLNLPCMNYNGTKTMHMHFAWQQDDDNSV